MGTYNLVDAIVAAGHSAELPAIYAGTSTFDCTAIIQSLFHIAEPRMAINFPVGQVGYTNRIYPESHGWIINAAGCQLLNVGSSNLSPLYINGWNNWQINGLRINMANTTGAPGESALSLFNVERFAIRDAEFVLTYGDGISMGSDASADPTHRTRIGILSNIKTEACGRNAVSFAGCYDILLEHVQAKGDVYNAPKSGFAFEPDYGLTNENITLIECSSTYNAGHGAYLDRGSPNGGSYGGNVGINFIGGRYSHNGGYGIKKGGYTPSIPCPLAMGGNSLGDYGA